MKNVRTSFVAVALTALATSCNILDQYPQTGPSTATFYSNEEELVLAVNAAYTALYWQSNDGVNYPMFIEGSTDLVYIRGTYANMNVIQAGQANAQTAIFASVWSHFYKQIAICNSLLENMKKSKDVVSPEVYAQIEAQARFLRAYCYHYMVFLYGDIPYIDYMLNWDSPNVKKEKASEIVKKLYTDLDFAAENLPQVWDSANYGRVTSGCALALKARIALYAGDYETAAQSAKSVMDSACYAIDDDYGSLFTYDGVDSKEIILSVQYLNGVKVNGNPKYLGTRLANGYSIIVPLQNLVDTYQCTDGKAIDKSLVYNPGDPFNYRDPRLKASILYPGEWHSGFKFETHPDSLKTSAIINGEEVRVGNLEVTNAYGTFTGYICKKYFDERDIPDNVLKSELPFILFRYAEVLLTYAEAKIELGQVDNSVIDAINAVRHRKGVLMPKVSISSDNLRETVRYERTVEFAMEGFRLFDIRRWKIAEFVMSGQVLGRRTKAHWFDAVIPSIDEHGKVTYPDETIFNSLGTMTFNKSNGYLWPIPQTEIDKNPLLAE